LEVTDVFGFKNKITKTITIYNRKPDIDFEFTPVEPFARKNIQFIDKSEDLDGDILTWTWEFGDGNNSYSTAGGGKSYSYQDDGFYIVKLTVIDNDGASSSITKNINIRNNPPNAKMQHNKTIYTNELVTFTDISNDIDGDIVKREWTLDDGTKASERVVSRIYEDAAISKTITLKVWDDDDESHITTYTFDVISVSDRDLIYGFSPIDIGFFIFIVIMVVMVIFLSRKFGLK
jgi:PKD repeat protein